MRIGSSCFVRLVMTGCLALCWASAALAESDGVLQPASKRYSTPDNSEVPDFQRHVSPLLGRLGCNGRSCHGSFQGQGGLRLSLFGYDFSMDHRALLGEGSATARSRVNRESPESSLILKKPLLAVEHEGGQRFDPGSWPHHLIRRWIESGAAATTSPQVLDRLEVRPTEIVFDRNPTPIALRVVAIWANGDREDVTPLCRFRSNDDSVATVGDDGRVQSVGPGDTHVVVFYDNGITAVPVMRPLARLPARIPQSVDSADAARLGNHTEGIDRWVLQKLQKLDIAPSALCSDAEFLRRASLDLTGTLPTPAEVEQFLSDRSNQKRRQKIDELLERPAYAAWWANKLCDFTGCNPAQQAELGQETSVQWYMWTYERIRENVPYDELVSRIVLATGRDTGQTYEEYAEEMSAYHRDEDPADFSQRRTMPHYWTRRTMRDPEKAAEAFAHNFLGLRLQCAQCHKHPFAPWTQEDYRMFSDVFATVKYGVAPASREEYRALARNAGLEVRGDDGSEISKAVFRQAQRGRTIPWRELYFETQSRSRTTELLRSGPVTIRGNQDPREPVMNWMADRHNPWFARAFVNRVWAGYFHRGIIHPPDDLNPANPPSNPALLDWLVAEFINQGMDIKWLHRTITNSATYQRSWIPNDSNRNDLRNFSRAIPRRMPAEVVYDSLKQSLAATDQSETVRTDLSRRAIGHLSMRLAGTYAMQVFGKPDRALNCDCERDNQSSLLQAIFLQNDPLIDDRLTESGWLKSLAEQERNGALGSTQSLVREAWLRTLSREPTETESIRAVEHVKSAETITAGLRDLMWALLNTKEYLLIH